MQPKQPKQPKKPKIILLNGLKRSGKDYSADILLNLLPNSKKMAFADNMKTIIKETFGITYEELDYWKNNRPKIILPNSSLIDFREILQRFGTEAMKPIFGDNIWARLVVEEILKTNAEYIIISDFRFLIEYEEMKKYFDVVTLHILDKNNIDLKDKHSSENELNNFEFDYIIDNTKKDPDILKDYLQSFIDIKLGK